MAKIKADSVEDEFLKTIQSGNERDLDRLYAKFFPGIRQFVLRNSGKQEDAEDVFQEALLAIYRKLKSGGLTLSCSFNTYLYSVCRNLWLKQLKRRKPFTELQESGNHLPLDEDLIESMAQQQRQNLYLLHFSRLGADCQKLLNLFFSGKKMKEIAHLMGFGSESYAKKRKFQCKEKLTTSIKSDPLFEELNA